MLPDEALNSVDASVYMSDMYDIHTGIYNHNLAENSNPLSTVIQHPADDFTTDSHIENIVRTYAMEEIYDKLGLSFIEYISLPIDIAEHVLKTVREIREKEPNDKKIMKEFDKLK